MSEHPQEIIEALPAAHVLSYITSTGSPTKVRRVASWMVLSLGLATWTMAAGVGWMMGSVIYLRAVRWGGGLTLQSVLNAMYEEWRWGILVPTFGVFMALVFLVGVPLAFLAGVFLVSSTGAVKAGKRVPCLLCWGSLMPLLTALSVATALFSGEVMLEGTPLGGKNWAPMELFWLLLLPVGLVLLLLVKDVCGILLWIARNPIEEKPALAFISGKPKP